MLNRKTNLELFKTGDVVKIYFLQRISRYRRVFSFIGLCTNFNKRTRNFTLQNYYGREYVQISLPFFSPNLFSSQILTSYNFKTSKSKLVNFKKTTLTSKTDILRVPNYKIDRQLVLEKFIYQSSALKSKEKKRLRNKFRV